MQTTPRDEFLAAQQRLLQHFDVQAESRFLPVPAVSGHAHVLSTGGPGPAAVMVPGFADPAAMWAPLIAELDEFTIHAVDRPCFGLTSCARHDTRTFRRLAVDFLEQLLDALGLDRPLFVSNSIGSLWTTWLALDRPDRVAALVHVGCPALMLGTSAPLPLRLLSTRPGRRLLTAAPPSPRQVEAFGRKIGGEDLTKLPELRDLLVASQRLPGVLHSTHDLLHTVLRLAGGRREISLTMAELSQLRQPMLLVWGDRDAFGSPAIGREAARVIPNVELHIIGEGGHVPWVGHPREVAAAAVPFMRCQGTGVAVDGGAGSGSRP